MLLGQGFELRQFVLQGFLRDAKLQQWLPMLRQLIQGGPQLLLLAGLTDQLVER